MQQKRSLTEQVSKCLSVLRAVLITSLKEDLLLHVPQKGNVTEFNNKLTQDCAQVSFRHNQTWATDNLLKYVMKAYGSIQYHTKNLSSAKHFPIFQKPC